MADVELKVPPTIAGPKRTEKGSGTIWITDKRVSSEHEAIESNLTPAGDLYGHRRGWGQGHGQVWSA